MPKRTFIRAKDLVNKVAVLRVPSPGGGFTTLPRGVEVTLTKAEADIVDNLQDAVVTKGREFTRPETVDEKKPTEKKSTSRKKGGGDRKWQEK